MPIYAYRCSTCGHAKDVLQKISDPVLSVCPTCGAPTFMKQVTAAGFQLKGSGWYVTDFRGDSKAPKAPAEEGGGGDAAKPGAAPAAESGGDKKAAEPAKSAPGAAPAPAPAASPAPAPAKPAPGPAPSSGH